MLGKLARTVFGSANDRFVKRQFKIVQQINALEPEIEKLNNDELKGKTDEFRRRLKEGETLDDICPRLSPSSARLPKERWDSAIMTSSLSAVLCCTRV